MRGRAAMVAVAVAVGLVGAGCSSGGTDEGPAEAPTTTEAPTVAGAAPERVPAVSTDVDLDDANLVVWLTHDLDRRVLREVRLLLDGAEGVVARRPVPAREVGAETLGDVSVVAAVVDETFDSAVLDGIAAVDGVESAWRELPCVTGVHGEFYVGPAEGVDGLELVATDVVVGSAASQRWEGDGVMVVDVFAELGNVTPISDLVPLMSRLGVGPPPPGPDCRTQLAVGAVETAGYITELDWGARIVAVNRPADQVAAALSSMAPVDRAVYGRTGPDFTGMTLGLRGLGPLEIGASIADLAEIGLVHQDRECDSFFDIDPYGAVSVVVEDGTLRGVYAWFDSSPHEIRTHSGIGAGSTRADVLAAYGDRIREYTTEVGWPPEVVEEEHRLEFVPVDGEDTDLRMIFSIDEDGLVRQIRTGVESAIQNPWLCT